MAAAVLCSSCPAYATAKHGGCRLLASDVPRFSADERLQISRAVYNSKYNDSVVLYEVHDAVTSEDHFT
ncbi:MAG: hypothetical protein LZF86_40028 [Nitrospira sp.]|nr:MAG: hypothetical protein LZF86_40028 [Nitrospira sp.]